MSTMPKVTITLPSATAKKKALLVLEKSDDEPVQWECQDYHVKKDIVRRGDTIVIKTEHTTVELDSDDISRIKKVL